MNEPTENKAIARYDRSDDVALADRFLRGDKGASEELFDQLKPVVWLSVSRVLGPGRAGDWEDGCQVAFMRLFTKLHSWRQESSLRTFAAVVATRVAIDMTRTLRETPLAPDHHAFVELESKEPDPAVVECLRTKMVGFKPLWRSSLRLKRKGASTRENRGGTEEVLFAPFSFGSERCMSVCSIALIISRRHRTVSAHNVFRSGLFARLAVLTVYQCR